MPAQRDLPHHLFIRAVANGLRHHCGVHEGARLIVAVSGGADSVALLRALALLAPRRTWNLQLAVGHVQHHLRQRGAETDARFVAALAKELDLPFLRADLDPPRRDMGNREAWARGQRYQALSEMARAFDASFIVTAHHGDDQLETMLMRLVRGCSVRGLAGMRWRRRLMVDPSKSDLWLVRPMLAVDRQLVQKFLAAAPQDWREDHTNRDASRWRVALRQNVLPVLRQLRPDVATRAATLARHLRDVNRLVESQIDHAADGVVRQPDGCLVLDRSSARALPLIVLSGLLRRLLIRKGAPAGSLGARNIGALASAIRDTTGGSRKFHFRGKVEVWVEREVVRLTNSGATDKRSPRSLSVSFRRPLGH